MLRERSALRHVELFAGGGGMAIGCRNAGFGAAEFYELDRAACETLRYNIKSTSPTLTGTVTQADVRLIQWGNTPTVQLLAGGAPCQPFSLGGRHRADKDDRNLFPEVLRATRALRPKIVLLENVRGLLRPSFLPYFDYVLAQLADPSVAPKDGELWQDHCRRITDHQYSRGYEPEYHVSTSLINAADFGVPQLRHRVFVVATERDSPRFEFPLATHSRDALLSAQASDAYWENRGVQRPMLHRSEKNLLLEPPGIKPWVTVRDALASLPAPAESEKSASMNHWIIRGARAYHGHSGSTLDWPSKTIKAGVHGVPGGENTFQDDCGNVRYYTLREAARIQSFPDDHIFQGSRTAVTKQIGNAVPTLVAAAIANKLYKLLEAE